MQATPSQEWSTNRMLLESSKCVGICPRVRKFRHMHLNDRVAISNMFDISFTHASARISLPLRTESNQEEVKGGSAGASVW